MNNYLRRHFMAVYNYTCQYCNRQFEDNYLEIDHIHPRVLGGENRFQNYTVACFDCNRKKRDSVLIDSPQKLLLLSVAARKAEVIKRRLNEARRRKIKPANFVSYGSLTIHYPKPVSSWSPRFLALLFLQGFRFEEHLYLSIHQVIDKFGCLVLYLDLWEEMLEAVRWGSKLKAATGEGSLSNDKLILSKRCDYTKLNSKCTSAEGFFAVSCPEKVLSDKFYRYALMDIMWRIEIKEFDLGNVAA